MPGPPVAPGSPVALEQRVVEDPSSAPAQIGQFPAAPVDIAGCLRAYEAGDYPGVERAARALARPRSAACGRRLAP